MPESITNIGSFLGLVGHYCQFHSPPCEDCGPFDHSDQEKHSLYMVLEGGRGIPVAEECATACSSVATRGPREDVPCDYRCERFCDRSSLKLGVG